MKILWITNVLFPLPSIALNIPKPVVGGWMYSLANELIKNNQITLSVATVYDGNQLQILDLENIRYYLIPKSTINTQYDSSLEKYWVQIKNEFNPDVIHIHGTEFAHGLAFIRSCGNKGVVLSIQGLISVYAKYYCSGISLTDILKNITFRDIIRQDNIFQQQRKFFKRGMIEQEYISSVEDVIGRTSWDKAHTLAINNKVQYHFNNETLRSLFYTNPKWEYSKCEKYSIFLSQAAYPIKGLHQVLKALPLIIRDFSNTKIYIAGDNIVAQNSLKGSIRRSGYARYLITLMRKLNILDRIFFLGPLNEIEIYEQYRKANVFVCPSSIENSPNSVGEAQLIGTPVISSFVGGVPDMVVHGETGLLYRFEEVELLASHICSIFSNVELSTRLSKCEIESASKRHSKQVNLDKIVEIYTQINTNSK